MTGFGAATSENLGLAEGQASLVDVGSTAEGDYVVIFGESTPATEGELFVQGLSTSRLAIWDALAECESNGNWSINTGNGFYGGIQFSPRSWRAVDGEGYP
ncbi:MAG: transglycosylase family protein, partial [Actinobacteria bacterium]|nr:transglycosylase family protein [Actinomycetota bacterium]